MSDPAAPPPPLPVRVAASPVNVPALPPRAPVMNPARVAASFVDGVAILVLGALAWKYERWVPYLIGSILLVAGVRIGDIRNALAGRDSGGNGAASLLLALFTGPWWHR